MALLAALTASALAGSKNKDEENGHDIPDQASGLESSCGAL